MGEEKNRTSWDRLDLSGPLEEYVKRQVATGLYSDASEVIREALRLKIHFDSVDAAKLEWLRRDIDVGWQQSERGEFADYSLADTLQRIDTEVDPSKHG